MDLFWWGITQNHYRMSVSISAVTEVRPIFKLLVVGERAVGKTSLAVRYVKGLFDMSYNVTVGI